MVNGLLLIIDQVKVKLRYKQGNTYEN